MNSMTAGGGGSGSTSLLSGSTGRIRHDSEPMDYHDSNAYFTQQLTTQNPYSQNPRRGTMASQNGLSDLDSGPASLPIMPMSVASNHSSSSSKPRQPPAKFKLDLPNSRPTTPAGTYLVSISLFLSPQMTFFPTLLCTYVLSQKYHL